MSQGSNKWVVFVSKLDRSPLKEPVPCPFCEATLAVFDVPIGTEGRFERWLQCPQCNQIAQILYGPEESN